TPPPVAPRGGGGGGGQAAGAGSGRRLAFCGATGKKPIRRHRALPGHAANRLQAALYKEMLSLVQQGVLSVADADIAVCYGPGLRWGVMGQSLQRHLGGGEGGIQHFMEQLMPPLVGMIEGLEMPAITPALKQTIVDGVLQEANGHTVDQLADAENDVLLGLLALRAQAGSTLP